MTQSIDIGNKQQRESYLINAGWERASIEGMWRPPWNVKRTFLISMAVEIQRARDLAEHETKKEVAEICEPIVEAMFLTAIVLNDKARGYHEITDGLNSLMAIWSERMLSTKKKSEPTLATPDQAVEVKDG